jgi:hypothetical protein
MLQNAVEGVHYGTSEALDVDAQLQKAKRENFF